MKHDNGLPVEPWLRRDRPGHDQRSVLRAAMEVFHHYGYDATSMDDVAEHLGITRPALYYHVPSKVELQRLALEQALVALENITVQQEAKSGPAAERLRFVVQEMVTVVANQLPAMTLLLRLRGNTEIERAALGRRLAFEEDVIELVFLACMEGSIRGDIDPRVAARILIGMVNSTADWYGPRNALTRQQLANEILSLGFYGLSKR